MIFLYLEADLCNTQNKLIHPLTRAYQTHSKDKKRIDKLYVFWETGTALSG